MPPILELRQVAKTFHTEEGTEFRALERIELDVAAGEFVSLIGPSGCGKSTLLMIVAGLIEPDPGAGIWLLGEPVHGPHAAIGMVFQEESTFHWRTALGNVEFGLQMRGMNVAERRKRALAMLRLVGLSGFEHRYPSELSGGMRQRVAIARALVLEPKVLLMDEPFGALDEQTRILLGEELLRIKEQLGQTILFVTHNINEAVQLSDRVVVMTARPGRIKRVFEIDLPRPRDSSVIGSDRFGKYVAEVWKELREESLKGFLEVEPLASSGKI